MQAENNKKSALVVISREFGIAMKDMKAEAERLTTQDRAELASAIARQNSIPAEEWGWEMVVY